MADECDLRGRRLAYARLTDGEIDRCVFTGCRLMGLNIQRVVLSDAVFERCRFDIRD
ncbi:pentapeptide repeat-containing protein [Actinomadura rubteroloni]|uniref:pentapeptide repeat-containing protein n=1 Tax=Actinomadura rubteroloni TaxID=1926885 RepID=UPI0011B0A745